MRFEIRAGGTLAILIGLGLLSGAVFLLGLVAGYEMGQQQENSRQFASIYPLPAAPAESPAAVAAATPVSIAASPASTPKAIAHAESTSAIQPPPVEAAPAPAFVAAATAAATPAARPAAVANASPPSERPERPAIAKGEPEITAPARHKGYSVQIEAAMDRSAADAMVSKLHRLGFSAYAVQTLIGGQTWYRVRIGPYTTPEEARAAEAQLHEQDAGSLATH